MKKTCHVCKIEKELEKDFHKDKQRRTGYRNKCKTCSNLYSKTHYKNSIKPLITAIKTDNFTQIKVVDNNLTLAVKNLNMQVISLQNRVKELEKQIINSISLNPAVDNILDRLHRLEKPIR